jgi:molybdate transport system ATP-binding protein
MHINFEHHLGDFSLKASVGIPDKGLTALFGPSGCGKTTVLRCMAGLERAEEARFSAFGSCWHSSETGTFVPPHKRPFGMVFQEANLFPHLTVEKNLLYGYARIPPRSRRLSLADISSLLGVEPLLKRMPKHLSGGERQRVAIGRALLCSPWLLLMDEPFSALEAASKQQILPFLERLRDDLDIPIIYVSHSLSEVKRLADWVVLMDDGAVQATGPFNDLIARMDLSMAYEEDAGVAIAARVVEHDLNDRLTHLECAAGSLWLPLADLTAGSRVRIGIAARDVMLTTGASHQISTLNTFETIIDRIDNYAPGTCMVKLRAGNLPLMSQITTRSREALGLREGGYACACIKAAALVV